MARTRPGATPSRARPPITRPPTLRLSIAIETPAWKRRLPDVAVRCRRWARAAFTAAIRAQAVSRGNGQTPPRSYEIALVLGDDALLQGLNRDFRSKNKPTNVLSFPAWDMAFAPPAAFRFLEAIPLGDIAIAWETTADEARAQGKTLAAHLAHLTVHGVLHLFGYDHLEKREAIEMESLETAVLARLGIADPYVVRAPRAARGQQTRSRSRQSRRTARSRI